MLLGGLDGDPVVWGQAVVATGSTSCLPSAMEMERVYVPLKTSGDTTRLKAQFGS